LSQENVERYRRSIQALNRRDPGALLALMDADVEAVPTVVALEGDVRGHDGVRRWYASVIDVFPDFTIEVVTVRDLGALTLAAIGFRGHGAGSDTPFEMTLWSAAEWREGKCVWWGNYRSEAEALEAVRLRE
jgi:ketosteroid isomerase-like protein